MNCSLWDQNYALKIYIYMYIFFLIHANFKQKETRKQLTKMNATNL